MPGGGRRGHAQRGWGGDPAAGDGARRRAGWRGRGAACGGRAGRGFARGGLRRAPGCPAPAPLLPAVRPPPLSAARPAYRRAPPPAAPPRPEPRRPTPSFHALCAPRPATPEAIPPRGLFLTHSAPPLPRHARCHPAAAVLPRAPRTRPRAVRPTPHYSPRTASRRPTLPGALMPPAVRPSPLFCWSRDTDCYHFRKCSSYFRN